MKGKEILGIAAIALGSTVIAGVGCGIRESVSLPDSVDKSNPHEVMLFNARSDKRLVGSVLFGIGAGTLLALPLAGATIAYEQRRRRDIFPPK